MKNGRQFKPLEISSYEDFKNDYQTPIPVVKYMISLIPKWFKTVLEPTPGVGNIKKELINSGYNVTAPDDYFINKLGKFDCVVMNPPFSHKFTNLTNAPIDLHRSGMRMGYWFLTDCMQKSNNVIALMPWFTISDSDVRMRALKRYGIRSITSLPRKTFQFARIQTMVIHLERGYMGDTIFYAYDCLTDVQSLKMDL